MPGRVGEDNEYVGGKTFRKIGNAIDNTFGRNSFISKAGHAGMHMVRGLSCAATGDMNTARGEFDRAFNNPHYNKD